MKFLFAFFALFSIVYAGKMDDLDDSCDNGNAKLVEIYLICMKKEEVKLIKINTKL